MFNLFQSKNNSSTFSSWQVNIRCVAFSVRTFHNLYDQARGPQIQKKSSPLSIESKPEMFEAAC